MNEDIPVRWQALMERAAVPASYRGLGERAGVSHEAARRVVRGWRVRRQTLEAVAEALRVDVELLRDLRAEPESDPWYPPESSSLLTHEEREALSRLITLLTRGREDDGPSTTEAPVAPARVTGTGRRRPGAPRTEPTPQPPDGQGGTDRP